MKYLSSIANEAREIVANEGGSFPRAVTKALEKSGFPPQTHNSQLSVIRGGWQNDLNLPDNIRLKTALHMTLGQRGGNVSSRRRAHLLLKTVM